MRVYKKVEKSVPAEVACDLCGTSATISGGDEFVWEDSVPGKPGYSREWTVAAVRVEVELRQEDDRLRRITRETWDICPRCFNTKIRPLLPSGVLSVV